MGINMACAEACSHVFRNETPPNKDVLSLGYPDIVVSLESLKKTLNLPNLKALEQPERVEKIAKFHGIDPSKGIIDTKSFFKELGATSFTSIDITKDKRDDELSLDLNYPQSFDGTFGLVVDFGTLEHCFNAVEGLKTIAKAVSPGGFVIHWNPFYMPNHGFYSFNPTFYADWYKKLGFTIISVTVWSNTQVYVHPTQRFTLNTQNEEFSNLVIVQAPLDREKLLKELETYPTQSKYVQAGIL